VPGTYPHLMGGTGSQLRADAAPWQRPLAQALASQPASARRQLRGLAPQWLDLASNDTLGLSRDPAVVAAAQAAAAREGVGAGASRLV